MSRRLRLAITLFAALWLPVQAMAGMVMSLCAEQGRAPMVAMADMADDEAMPADCPMHHPAADGQANSHDVDCSHCGICHLAATGFLPVGETAAPVVALAHVFTPPFEAAPASHIPEPPQQPPRRAA